jgi:pimeloyl-ACP methyl ester carboxylesterase
VADRGGKLSSRVFHPLTANPLALPLGRLSGFFDRFYADPVDLVKYLEHLEQMDAQVFLRMVSFMADHDAGPRLSEIQAPTLVIAGERDNFTPLHRSKLMADRIPGAELLILAEASHAAIIEEPDTIQLRIQRFLRERVRFSV